MIQLREKIELSPSLIDYKFKNPTLNNLTSSFPFYYFRRFLYYSGLQSSIQKELIYNERIAEYPYVFKQLGAFGDKIKTVMDIGSNDSILPLQLATVGYEVTALDQINTENIYHPNMKFICQDLFDNSFEDNTFDAIVSVSVIEHMGFGFYGDKVMEDADKKAFEEVYRMLKPGGVAVITIPLFEHGNYWDDKITKFTEERIDLICKPFKVLDKQLSSKQTKQHGSKTFEFFAPAKKPTEWNVWLLTLQK